MYRARQKGQLRYRGEERERKGLRNIKRQGEKVTNDQAELGLGLRSSAWPKKWTLFTGDVISITVTKKTDSRVVDVDIVVVDFGLSVTQ